MSRAASIPAGSFPNTSASSARDTSSWSMVYRRTAYSIPFSGGVGVVTASPALPARGVQYLGLQLAFQGEHRHTSRPAPKAHVLDTDDRTARGRHPSPCTDAAKAKPAQCPQPQTQAPNAALHRNAPPSHQAHTAHQTPAHSQTNTPLTGKHQPSTVSAPVMATPGRPTVGDPWRQTTSAQRMTPRHGHRQRDPIKRQATRLRRSVPARAALEHLQSLRADIRDHLNLACPTSPIPQVRDRRETMRSPGDDQDLIGDHPRDMRTRGHLLRFPRSLRPDS
jgi:hypothetical protein